jgi:DnaK suppressor protein
LGTAGSFEAWRERLLAELEEVEAEDRATAEAARPVTLDQQSVGRLSRMDAMQNQAMAQAQAARRQGRRRRIAAALARLEAGEFGYCTECGDEIAPQRLERDPTIPTCLPCARG